MTTVLNGIEGVKAHVGQHLGYSDWVEITQERVNLFAEATGDHQWIHVDVERANRESPFGGPVAHGYLTLSMTADLVVNLIKFSGFRLAINYGLDKVRFPAPVRVGARTRVGVSVLNVDDIPGGIQITFEFVTEVEGSAKPACVAHMLMRQMV